MRKRKFSNEGVMHVYQRTIDGFNLFYSTKDFLVFYTTVSIMARKSGICLLGMCLMIDHVHLLLAAEDLAMMSRFISSYTSVYVREFNIRIGRHGSLFETPYGSALKLDLKRIRSAIAYLFNNPVEKKLCKKAEDYRSYKDMLTAINSNTGSEYDIQETHLCKSDTQYRELLSYIKRPGHPDIYTILRMPLKDKIVLMHTLKQQTSASSVQIMKFLHIPRHRKQTANSLTINTLNKKG